MRREKRRINSLHKSVRMHGQVVAELVPILVKRPQPKGGGMNCQGEDQCGQATKGVWGMPRRQEAMKGVEDCDKPGGLVKRELIPGFPNDRALNP